ncbi:MAG: TetR/AcrR family transcriptional regulator [Flavobacteriaceae bacterium]
MQEKILHTASELFLNLGFKSVTMDDIASEIGISKKTIYTFYKTKTDLVKASVLSVFDQVSLGIDSICSLDNNPIDELFKIKEFVLNHLKHENSSPIFQLKKYYPKFHYELQKKQFIVMNDCVQENIKRGIADGLFRENVDVDFTSRIYFSGVTAIKDIELFPKGKHNMKGLMNDFLTYHIRSIATEKGLKELKTIIKKMNL